MTVCTQSKRWAPRLSRWGAAAWLAWALPAGPAVAASSGPPVAHTPAAVTVLNPDLAGLQPLPGGGLLAWGSDASIWQLAADSAASASSGAAWWRPAATPHDARVRGMAVAGSPETPVAVAVGDGGLLLRSDDLGRTWRAGTVRADQRLPVASVPSGTTDASLDAADLAAVDCAASLCVAVGPDNVLLSSHDAGAHWQPELDDAAPQGPLTGVAAAVGGGWWISSAAGQVWQGRPGAWRMRSLNPATAGARTGAAAGAGANAPVAADASVGSIDAIAADAEGLLLATADGRILGLPEAEGTARILYRSPRGSFTRIAPLPGAGAWVATGSEGACAYRASADLRWRSCGRLPQRLLRGLASSPDGQHWVLVGEGGLLMQGRPPQRPWRAIRLPALQERPDLEAVAWSEAHRGFVAVGPGGLVLHGSADGRDWTVAHSAPRHYVHDVVGTRGGGVLAALSYRTLARSDDGGRHWRSHRFTGLHEPAFLLALHADAKRGSVVVAGGQGSVMVAPDGEHWRHHSSGHGRDHLGLLPHPTEPELLLYGSGGTLMRVHSEAAAWHPVPLPAAEPMYGAFRGPDTRPWLLGGAAGDGAVGVIQRGGADGRQWQMQRVGRAPLRTGGVTPDGRALLVAGDGGAVFRAAIDPQAGGPVEVSVPPAAPHWQRVEAPRADWAWLQTDAAGRNVWLGGAEGAMARSGDSGLSWERVALPTDSAVRRPRWDARRQVWWMPGRDGTLLRSDDDGRHWHRVFTHTRAHLKGVWVDPHSGALLLYGERLVHLVPGDSP